MDLAKQIEYAVGSVTNSGFEKTIEINPQHTDYFILVISRYNGAYMVVVLSISHVLLSMENVPMEPITCGHKTCVLSTFSLG